jgi:hypothetical protein
MRRRGRYEMPIEGVLSPSHPVVLALREAQASRAARVRVPLDATRQCNRSPARLQWARARWPLPAHPFASRDIDVMRHPYSFSKYLGHEEQSRW